jgi:3-hydroxyisobutyrate dehydrogenase-like beta-hydroxyacid dehydrogenase
MTAHEASARTTAFLHPGEMGAALAHTSAGTCIWAGHDRSPATRVRAEAAGMTDVGSLDAVVARADTIMSICPPDQATAVADQVAARGYEGVYVDANAISPATARAIGQRFERFVDGGVVGPPPRTRGTTRLYLSGSEASRVAPLWNGSDLDVRVIEGGPGAASALKMCFAGWTKGTSALLLAVNALAVAEGVDEALSAEWAISIPDLPARAAATALGTSPKAWRFVGEMEEIASTYAAAGLPDGFHRAAAETYRRLAASAESVDLPAAIDALLAGDDG